MWREREREKTREKIKSRGNVKKKKKVMGGKKNHLENEWGGAWKEIKREKQIVRINWLFFLINCQKLCGWVFFFKSL